MNVVRPAAFMEDVFSYRASVMTRTRTISLVRQRSAMLAVLVSSFYGAQWTEQCPPQTR